MATRAFCALPAPLLASLLAVAPPCAASAAQSTPALGTSAAVRAAFLEANPGARIYTEHAGHGGRVSRVYGTAFSHGKSAVDSANRFLVAYAGIFASDFSQLMPVGPNGDGAHVLPLGYNPADESFRFSLVGYSQHVNGIPVFRGDVRLLVRNEPGYPLVLVANGLRDVNAFAQGFKGRALPPSKIDVARISRRALNQFGPGSTVSEQEQVIWAGYDGAPAQEVRLAYKFIVTGTAVFDRTAKQRMLYVVDAEDSRILFQEDQILNADITATVRGNASTGVAADECVPELPAPLPYTRVTVGASAYFADSQGVVVIPNPNNANLTLVSNLGTQGRWFIVNDVSGAESTVSASATSGAVDLLHNAANTAEDVRAEVNAYLHANRVRDYLLAFNPSFPTIATETGFPVAVQLGSNCNAHYDGSSINFYSAGGGCRNTAYSTIVHHEYGHHIVAKSGSGQGPYGEGFGDAMALLVTDDPRLGLGLQECNTPIRNADNDAQYSPYTCLYTGLGSHPCGMLFSGCVWSTRTYLAASYPTSYRSIVSNLTIDSVLLHQGHLITPAIAIDFLVLDDNDAYLNNGTPHYEEIKAGFGDHNMSPPPLQTLGYSFPSGLPQTSSVAAGTSFPVVVSPNGANPVPGTATISYRIGASGPFTTVAMPSTGLNQYRASLPPAPCGSRIQYYFTTQATALGSCSSPLNAPAELHDAYSGAALTVAFADDAEIDRGWRLGDPDDTAAQGFWVRGDPSYLWSNNVQTQPEDDVTAAPGVNCYYTGYTPPGADPLDSGVLYGKVTLTSPVMNGLGGVPILSYYRWFVDGYPPWGGEDPFIAEVSNDNGATWVQIELLDSPCAECAGGWFRAEHNLGSVIQPSDQMRVRFIVDEMGWISIAEAAIDEVRLVVVSPLRSADLSGDGVVKAEDLALLLGGWGLAGPTDLDGDGTTSGPDLAILLSAWGSSGG